MKQDEASAPRRHGGRGAKNFLINKICAHAAVEMGKTAGKIVVEIDD